MAIHDTFPDSTTGAGITLIKLPIPTLFTFSSPPRLITSSMALVRNDKADDVSPTARPQEKLLLDFVVHTMLIAYGDAIARMSTDDAWEIPSDDESSSSALEERAVPVLTLNELAVQMIDSLPLPAHGPPAAFNDPETVMCAITWVVRAALWLEMTPRIMVDVGMARITDVSPLAKKQERAVLDKVFKQSWLMAVKV